MVQVKIYGLERILNPIKEKLSEVIHSCIVEEFNLPIEKKFHRFFPLKSQDFIFPSKRTKNYTIIEILMFEGRSINTKKKLIKELFEKIQREFEFNENDIEIVFIESPKYNWGIRGRSGDELKLNYKTEI